MVKEAIILAGGLGTRLRAVLGDLPKCMAPVNGIPFIHFIIAYLKHEGIEKFIFSLGYKNEVVIDYLDRTFKSMNKKYIIETEPLGTGGAIKKAASDATHENVIIVNGDTLFKININSLVSFHYKSKADCTLALKEMTSFSRYGSVELFPGGAIRAFHEKKYCEKGNINGGIYALNVPIFLKEKHPDIFSFEKWLEENTASKKLYGDMHNNYFIDIGIPEDYERFDKDYNHILAKKNHPGNPGAKSTPFFLENFFELLY